MASEQNISVYGIFLTAEEMAERATWHETTYLEAEIPAALSKKLDKYITSQVKKFHNKCGCGRCEIHKSKSDD